ncbi:MAG: TIM barrel protein [Flexilinea sp.]
MKFGIMSIDFKRLSLETTFCLAKEYGFDGLEIFGSRCHLDPADFSDDSAKRIRLYQNKYGVAVPMYTPNALNLPLCICSPFSSERSDGIAYYKKAVDIAQAIGCPRLLVVADHPGYFTPRRQIWGYLVESIKQICAYGHGKGIEITIEPLTPMESPVVSTVDDCVELIEDVDDNCLHAMMDIVPPTVVREPISKYFDMLGDRLNYIHICNTDGKSDAHTRLGEGILPIIDVLDVIKRHGYAGFVTSELYSECFYDPELMLANTARFIKNVKQELNL